MVSKYEMTEDELKELTKHINKIFPKWKYAYEASKLDDFKQKFPCLFSDVDAVTYNYDNTPEGRKEKQIKEKEMRSKIKNVLNKVTRKHIYTIDREKQWFFKYSECNDKVEKHSYEEKFNEERSLQTQLLLALKYSKDNAKVGNIIDKIKLENNPLWANPIWKLDHMIELFNNNITQWLTENNLILPDDFKPKND